MRCNNGILILTVLICLPLSMYSQNTSHRSRIHLKPKMYYGSIVPHHASIVYNLKNHIAGLEINLYKRVSNTTRLAKIYNHPKIGIAYYTGNMGNKDVYGQLHAVYPYIHLPLWIPSNRFQLNYKIGFGFSCLTQPFNLENNLQNIAVGSHENIYFRLGCNAQYTITPRFELFAGLGFSHVSNGNYRKPNLGLNVMAFSGGISYALNTTDNSIDHSASASPPDKPDKTEYSIIYAAGLRRYEVGDPKDYFASSLCIDAGKYLSWKHKVGIGGDLFYNQTLAPLINGKQPGTIPEQKKIRAGIHGFHDFLLHKLAITMHIGYYIYTPYPQQRLYERIGLRYKISEHMMANFSIKAHYAVADFIEWGIGYYWNK